jgi:hypothetical protein
MFGREARTGAFMLGLASGVAGCFGLGLKEACAQPAAPVAPATNTAAPDVSISQAPVQRLYGGLEYLHWWVKGAPLSVPLLTTGPDVQPIEGGFIRGPSVTILYGSPLAPAMGGNSTQNFPGLSGGRATLGYWLDDQRRYAIEGEIFSLQQGTATFQTSSDSNGLPPMRIPVFNSVPYFAGGPGGMVVPVSEDGVPVSVPNDVTGNVSFNNKLNLWGVQANGVAVIYRDASWEVSGLGGFRYLNLSEAFNLRLNIFGVPGSAFTGESGWAADQFATGNHFYGATLGVRAKYNIGPVSIEATGRVSFGVDNESLDVSGGFQEFNTPIVSGIPGLAFGQRPVTQGPNGIFAQPSNEGSTSGTRFAVVPEVGIKLGYHVTPSLELTVGYDFLFISSVLRPTDQIDRNFSKGLPFLQDPTATVGPTRRFKTTDFYAQGITFGVSYRF